MSFKKYFIPFIIIVSLTFVGCSGGINVNPEVAGSKEKGGIFHRLWRLHNLWLIAEAYNVPVGKLAKANKLKTPFDITTGDTIFIPGATKYQKITYKDPGWNVSLKSMSWPLEGDIIRDWGSDEHAEGLEGIDIHALEGSIVKAARDGWVVYAGDDFTPYGKMIILQHRFVLASIYACNSENLVKAGTRVNIGEPIAKVGKCKGSKQPSLHFEAIYFNKRINPHKALDISTDEMLEKYDRKFQQAKD